MKFDVIEDAGLTQLEFAELIHTSRPTVNLWINGRKEPSSANRALLKRALHVVQQFVDKGYLPLPRQDAHRAKLLATLGEYMRQTKTD